MPSLSFMLMELTVSNDFTNPQRVGSYIDCSGLSFAVRFGNPNGAYDSRTLTVDGSSLINGVYNGDSPGTVSATYTITASPAQFTTTGSQTVTFTAEQTGAHGGSATATKSVTVQTETATTKNVYVFTADGRRVIWGTIEVQEPSSLTEVTIVNPNNSAVFYNIPEGTSIYLDAAGTQPVTACTTKITGTTVYMSGDGDCEYIYNDGIKYIIMDPSPDGNKIDYAYLSERYSDSSLTTCVQTSYPVASNQEG